MVIRRTSESADKTLGVANGLYSYVLLKATLPKKLTPKEIFYAAQMLNQGYFGRSIEEQNVRLGPWRNIIRTIAEDIKTCNKHRSYKWMVF